MSEMAKRDLEFHTPPRSRGRAVTVSYAATDDGQVVERRAAEGRAASYRIAPAAPDDVGDYWRGEPTPASGWVALGDAGRRRHGLDGST
jgi:hypothetical protein